MSTGLRYRRLIALIAAYVIALQGLLSAVTLMVPATAWADAIICSNSNHSQEGQADNSRSIPLRYDSTCAICPLSCDSALPARPSCAKVEAMLPLGVGATMGMHPARGADPVGNASIRSCPSASGHRVSRAHTRRTAAPRLWPQVCGRHYSNDLPVARRSSRRAPRGTTRRMLEYSSSRSANLIIETGVQQEPAAKFLLASEGFAKTVRTSETTTTPSPGL